MSNDRPATPEILDSDPRPPTPGPQWERILGLLLVLGLAGFGLAGWWTESTHQSAYHAGLRAELADDWEAAWADFARADDYQDAKVRAHNVASRIRERNTAYTTAAAAFARQDWAALIPALDRLKQVAPTYRDTPRFVQTLEDAVYTPALSGTVALRPKADPPGWYTYRPGGWRYLSGSDPQSRIQARCPDGSWLLDVPATPGPAPATAGPGTVADRHLAVLASDGSARARLDDLPLGDSGRYVCDAGRVWQLRSAPGLPRVGNDIFPVFAYTTAYQTIGEPGIHTPVFPNGNWYVLDVVPGGDLLVVDVGEVQKSDRVRLYKTALDGSAPRLLGAFAGSPILRFISPDTRFAVLVLQGTVPVVPAAANVEPPRQTSLVLLDLTGARPPQTLAQVQRSAQYHPDDPDLFGYFLTQPPYRGRILASQAGGTQQQIRLIDPAQPGTPQIFPLVPRLYGSYNTSVGAEGGLLLAGLTTAADFTAPDTAQPISATLLYLPPQGDPQAVSVPSANDRVVVPFAIRAGQALYLDYPTASSPNGPLPLALYHLPLTDFPAPAAAAGPLTSFTAPAAAPAPLYAGELPPDSANASLLPFWPGTDWLAYVTPTGDLHARRYDGTGDVALDHGFGGFIPWSFADASNP